PFCRGLRVAKSNCLATIRPELAAEWHPGKNGVLTAEMVPAGSGKKVWWVCSRGHEWETTVLHRTADRTACPYCANKKTDQLNCLANTHPGIAGEWHPTKNGSLTPMDVTAGSPRKVWWWCGESPDHEWAATIANRTRLGSGCPRCNKGWTVEGIRSF